MGFLKNKKYKDLTGQKFNKLTAIERLHIYKGKSVWLWECECGNKKEIVGTEVVQGKTKSCGCGKVKHGDTKSGWQHPIYQTYHNMISKCTIPSDPSFHNYGEAGIAVCSEWLNDDGYLIFKNWSLDNGYKEGLSLERIDKNKNYEPLNCRWVVRYEDLTGLKFSRLTVIKKLESNKHGKTQWLCKCDCKEDSTIITNTGALKSGNTKSCGCLVSELVRKANTTHGKSKDRIYRIHTLMKRRCYSKKDQDYKDYGGRGIKICDEWLDKENGFMNFHDWAMENGYSDDLSIDRIDVNGNYEPNNCKWATDEAQANNKRNNHYVEINGVVKTITQWAKENNLAAYTIRRRIEKGISGEELLMPVDKIGTAEYASNNKGVTWHSKSKKWQVRLTINKKRTYIGMYDEEEDAIKAKYRYLHTNNLTGLF